MEYAECDPAGPKPEPTTHDLGDLVESMIEQAQGGFVAERTKDRFRDAIVKLIDERIKAHTQECP